MADMSTPINEMGLYRAYRQLCNRNDAKQIRNKLSEQERKEIIRLHNEGLSQAKIVKMTGRSEKTVYRLLKNEGLLAGAPHGGLED